MRAVFHRALARLAWLATEAGALLGLMGGALLLFFYLARVVFVEESGSLDAWAFRLVDEVRAAWPALTAAVQVITFFASLPWLVAVAVAVPLGLWRRGYRREALEVFWSVAGGALLNQLLKLHYHRLRPSTALLPQPGLSFPSGHAMLGMALYGCLAWLLWRHGRHPGWALALVAWAGLIGLTRVYLHVHFATDVLAGFAAGLVWLALLRTLLRYEWPGRRGRRGAS